MVAVHEAMKAARRKSGLKQWQLALLAGLSPAQLCWYETGRATPGLYALVAIADALHISIDELIGREKGGKNHD